MQRAKVLWLFVLETALLGALGTGAGALAASGIALALNGLGIVLPDAVQVFLAMEELNVVLDPRAILVNVVALTAVTVAAAVLPALRAARLRPVTAMHHIG
jgi:ABC-type lipoprotein release transport system permease subunit